MNQLNLVRPRLALLAVAAVLLANLVSLFHPLPTLAQLFFNSVGITTAAVVLKVPLRRTTDGALSTQLSEQLLGKKEAMQFPFIASGMLFSLYMVFKYLPKQYVAIAVSAFFGAMSLGVLCSLSAQLLSLLLPLPDSITAPFYRRQLGKVGQMLLDVKELQISALNLMTLPYGLAVVGAYLYSREWMLNNLLGAVLTIQSVGSLPLGSTKIGLILLWGLFFYDVFWVFGTDVMVAVAKSLNIPALLKFPLPNPTEDKKFSMLGLGDMVVPGLFMVVALKIDIENNIQRKVKELADFRLPYFHWAVFGYALGILATGAVMLVFEAAQPALLYLVPALTLAFFAAGLHQGDLWESLRWQEKGLAQQTGTAPTDEKQVKGQ